MDRSIKFGQILAIAEAIGQGVLKEGESLISENDWKKYSRRPLEVFERIHSGLMEHQHKFSDTEYKLMLLLGEILSDMEDSEFSNEALDDKYVLAYHKQGNEINNMIGVNEAAEILKLTPGTVKNYCSEGKIKAKKIGKTWIIDKSSLQAPK